MRLRGILASSIVSLSLAALFGCSSSNSTTPPSGTGGPGVGSTFTVYYSTDNTNQLDSTTYIVSNADTACHGKTNVLELLQVVLPGQTVPDPQFFAFESSGDVSVWPQPSLSANWFTLPYATHTHTASAWEPDHGDSLLTIADADSPATGSVTISGTPYPTQRVKVTVLHDVGDTTVYHYEWSPDLHFLVKKDQDASADGTTFGEHWWLKSFVKK
jgi:hypothetical protein